MSTENQHQPPDIYATLREANPEALTFDGLEAAYLGVCHQKGRDPVALYDRQKIIEVLMERDGMTWEEAEEFFEYNIADAYVGPNTPAIVDQQIEEC